MRVPSPENCQPWKIVVRGNLLEIFHSSQRSKLANYPDDLSVLGLGLISESIDLACSTKELEAQIAYFLEERSDRKPWMTAKLLPTGTTPDPLAKGIFISHTDRRRFAGGSIDDQVFKDAVKETSNIKGANLYLTDKYPDAYIKLLHDANVSVLNWDEMRHDMMRWVRFTDKEIESNREGMTWRSFLRRSETFFDYLRSRLWWLAIRLDWFPPWLQNLETTIFDDANELSPGSYDDCAGLGCVTTVSDTPEDLIAAGRLIMRVWLLLNTKGYSFHPISNVSSTSTSDI